MVNADHRLFCPDGDLGTDDRVKLGRGEANADAKKGGAWGAPISRPFVPSPCMPVRWLARLYDRQASGVESAASMI